MRSCIKTPIVEVSVPESFDLRLPLFGNSNLQVILTKGSPPVAVDITPDTIEFILFSGVGAPPFLTKSFPPGSHEDPTNGTIVVALTPADFAALDQTMSQFLRYEVRRTRVDGQVFPHITGQVELFPAGAS